MTQAADAALPGSSREIDEERGVTADARTVAIWTLVSRITGFGRVAIIAAVLGPTYFGNLFQTVLLIPYVLCELLARSMIPALLAPPMVQAYARNDGKSARLIAQSLLGAVLLVFSAAALLGILAAPYVLWIVTLAVPDAAVRAEQISLGGTLLVIMMPQMVLYGLVGVGIGVQHANRRFAFATAATSIENIATIGVMGVTALVFGVGLDIHGISAAELWLLGLGSTSAVALHAAAQWWGAYRLGVPLLPNARWEPQTSGIIRRLIPSAASAGLNSLGWLALTIASGRIPGGAAAFQIGRTFFNLPNALSAWPVAFAQLPRLSQHFAVGAMDEFGRIYRRSLQLALFAAIPGALLFVGMSKILAGAVAFGDMNNAAAIGMIAAVLIGLGPGIVGEAIFIVSSTATLARLDAASSFYAMAIRVLIVLAGIPLALACGGTETSLLLLAMSFSVGTFIAAIFLSLRVQGRPSWAARESARWTIANLAISLVAIAPVALLTRGLQFDEAHSATRFAVALFLIAISAGIYFALQYLRGSPELRNFFNLARATTASPDGSKP